MILKMMRKNTKTIMWALIIAVVATFVMWNVGSQVGEGKLPSYAGRLFDKKVSFEEYFQAFEDSRAQAMLLYGGNFNKALKFLKLENQAWDRLMLLKEAKAQKIMIDDKEVVSSIQNIPHFQREGIFDANIYSGILKEYLRMDAHTFEEGMRKTLIIAKLIEKTATPLPFTDDELKAEYRKENEKIEASYLLIPSKEFESQAEALDPEIEQFYNINRQGLRRDVEVKLEYVKIPEKEKAEAVAGSISEKGFAEAAKEHSLEVKELGFFTQDELQPDAGYSLEITRAAFELGLGETSEPILTSNGYFIIRLKEKHPPRMMSFEEAKPKIKEFLMRQKADGLALKKAEGLLPAFSDAEKAASVELKPAGAFGRGDYVPGLGEVKGFADLLFAAKENEIRAPSGDAIAGPFKTELGYAIFKVTKLIPSKDEAFEKDKEQFRAALIQKKRLELFTNWLTEVKKRANLTSNLGARPPAPQPINPADFYE